MDFAETVAALGSLAGQPVEAEVWGVEVDSGDVASLDGELRHMQHLTAEELPDGFAELIGETAEVFVVGEAQLSLWPSRFIEAQPMPNTRGWLEVRTKDAVIRVGPRRVPWVD